jgi:2-polyprenyl-3-methyl-5-hydroxy-6-metoxy-1,4-benzoquinol methylase
VFVPIAVKRFCKPRVSARQRRFNIAYRAYNPSSKKYWRRFAEFLGHTSYKSGIFMRKKVGNNPGTFGHGMLIYCRIPQQRVPMSVHSAPSNARVCNNLAAFQLSSALRSAIEIDLFTSIADGHDTSEALAAHCRADPRGVRILADYLVIQSYLIKQDSRYALAEESRLYLDRRSPTYVGDPIDFIQAPFVWAQFNRLTECVRGGGAKLPLNLLEPNHEMWVRFARVMATQMHGIAQLLVPRIKKLLLPTGRGPRKILDIAAGHGLFGIAFAKDNPACRVVAQDWPAVLEVTRENAERHGVANRITLLPGNVMDVDLGAGYDLVLIPNLMHHFDRQTNITLLKKVRAALQPGGLAATVEFAPNDDRISPSSQAAFALFMLATTPAGDAYTVNEMGAMYEAAGYGQISAWELGFQRLIAGMNPEPALRLVTTTQFAAGHFGRL